MDYKAMSDQFEKMTTEFLDESKRVSEKNMKLALALAGVSHACLLAQMFCRSSAMIEEGKNIEEMFANLPIPESLEKILPVQNIP